jgi:hypothetical protein
VRLLHDEPGFELAVDSENQPGENEPNGSTA